MVYRGKWYAEPDYSLLPPGQWCDCDHLANAIMKEGYTPKTTMENLVENIFDSMKICEELQPYYFYYKLSDWLSFVQIQGGFERFDTYEPIGELKPWPDDVPRAEPRQPPKEEKWRMSTDDAVKVFFVVLGAIVYMAYIILRDL